MSPLTPNDNIEVNTIAARLSATHARIAAAERQYDRTPGSVTLVAVTKAQDAATILTAYQAGQRHFGESYLQETLPKLDALANLDITWHFIGAMQSNKTRDIASRFAWVHSIDRLKIAERLHEQRPQHLPPLNVCIQVNIGAEQQKAGVAPAQLASFIAPLLKLSRLRVRGLMALPPLSEDFNVQRGYFRQLRFAFETLLTQAYPLDTLSMGMSGDLEAAIAEGATLVRVGSALFGDRPRMT
jgi:pyridoxal phosphate enzyme (YggS family)